MGAAYVDCLHSADEALKEQVLASCGLGRERILHAELYLGVQDPLLHWRPFSRLSRRWDVDGLVE